MDANSFLEKFAKILETDDDISLDSKLQDLEDWDSLTVMSTYGWLKSIKANTSVQELQKLIYVKDLAALAGVKI